MTNYKGSNFKKAKSLEDRERIFIEKVNKVGKYEYISGYTKLTNKVKAIHKSCGNEIEVSANVLLRENMKHCHKCEPSTRFKTIEEIQVEVDNLKTNNHYTVIERFNDITHTSLIVKCKKCNSTYKTIFSNIKKNQFQCCSQNGTSVVAKHAKHFSNELIKKMKKGGMYYLGSNLQDFIENEAQNKKYIETGFINIDDFVNYTYNYLVNELYEDKLVGQCEICSEIYRGKKNWGSIENFEARICKECGEEEYYCHACGEYKYLKEFHFDYEKKEFDTECKECKGDLVDEDLLNSLFR